MLAEVGIPAAVLRDSSARVPLADYAALYNHVVRTLDDEGFGLFSIPLKSGVFEFLCRGMVGSLTLGEALTRAAAFLRLVLPDLAVRISVDDVSAKIEIVEVISVGNAPDDPRRVFAFEWLLRLLHALACWLAGRGLSLESVQFPYARPPHADDYALIYTEDVRFGYATLVARLQAEAFALPISRDQEAVSVFLKDAPGKIAVLYRRDHELAGQIRDILATSCPDVPGLNVVADRLRLSLRTVQRRLRQEGSSFRAVKTAVRRDIALAQVGHTRRAIAAIALDLGYAEPSAFFRAFVEWTGEAPTSYRKKTRALTY